MVWGPLALLLVGAVLVPGVITGLLFAGERGVGRLRPTLRQRLRPWVWLTPALVLIAAVLVYPAARTLVSSVFDRNGTSFVGLANFAWAFSDPSMLQVLRNNALWLVIFPILSVLVALVVALLSDRLGWEGLARMPFLLPTVISFAVTGVIWTLMYQYEPAGRAQRGTINGFLSMFGVSPEPWITAPATSNYALIVAGVWAHVGLATIILSAAVKAVPAELLEAARMDGAGEMAVMTRIVVPMLWPTILVVATTQVIYALKVFDIVYVMTNGNYGTDVIANRVYSELFVAQNVGHASAIAMILFALASPIIAFNLRQFRAQEAEA